MESDLRYLKNTLCIISFLQSHKIDPILYGSIGVSLYLGKFKTFNDIDFLIEKSWLHERWPELMELMKEKDYILINEREHEFKNSDGVIVAFAEETVLMRDKIVGSLNELIVRVIDGINVRTLMPQLFKQAYLFSEKDGYRKHKRGKKDRQVIELLNKYIQRQV